MGELTLGEFLSMLQLEAQKVSEYLARKELRKISNESPSQVQLAIEKLRLQIPVEMAVQTLDEMAIAKIGTKEELQRILEKGYIKIPKKERMQYNVVVRLPPKTPEMPVSYIEVNFLPVSKKEELRTGEPPK